ncbi:MAG TPA: tetratricopeptide repeat protein [Thermoanaerobaculia bacterium]|nr:tetratricopeptide repeat protein [Thermoanaerobaculia bacterium]
MQTHPSEEVLEDFILSQDRGRLAVLWHLIGCTSCRSKFLFLPRPERPPLEGEVRFGVPDYDRVLAEVGPVVRSFERALKEERAAAPGLYVELTEPPAEQRAVRVANPRFHTWGVAELLVERSLEVSDSAYGEELGLLALRLVEHLDASRYGAERIEDLRAQAWAHIGNACRLRSDLQGAEDAFGHAFSHLEKGTQDALEQAVLLDLEASLRRDQRRFEDAFKLLRRAVEIFLDYGERHRAGRSLVSMSIVHSQSGNPAEGIPLLQQALEMLDPELEPRLLLCARHNLAVYFADVGRFWEAQAAYRAARPLYRSFPDAWTQNRRKWIKGRISRGLGQLRQAESLFLASREGFLAEGIPYDTALVSLEIALLYAEQGRTAELKQLAVEMVPIFSSRHIHREALAALSFLQQVLAGEALATEVVARVADYLKRAQHDPELRFQGAEA